MMDAMKTIALIPCYNEEANIAAVVRGCRKHVDEVLVLDDGSADATAANARSAGAKVIRFESNRGKGAALNAGYRYAIDNGFDCVITLDGDAQHDPDEIPRFIQAAESGGAHIVLGTRMGDISTMPRIRRFSNRLTSWVISCMAGQKMTDTQIGYRLIKRQVMESIHCTSSRYDAESELLIKAGRAGFGIAEIPVKTIYRGETSSISPVLETLRFIRLVLRNW